MFVEELLRAREANVAVAETLEDVWRITSDTLAKGLIKVGALGAARFVASKDSDDQ